MTTPTGAPSSQDVDLWFLVVWVVALTVLYSFTINILFGHQTYWRSLEEWMPRQLMRTLSHMQQFSSSFTPPSHTTTDNSNYKISSYTTISRSSKKRAIEKSKENIRKGRAQLGELDDNVLVSILTYLPASDIMEISSINKSFGRASASRYLWSLKWHEIKTRIPSHSADTDEEVSTCHCKKDFFTRCWYLRHSLLTGKTSSSALSSDDTSSFNVAISPNDETSWPSICPVLVHGDVYELRPFLRHHPGGALILLEWKGQDASTIFHLAAHSHQAKIQMKQFTLWDQQDLLGRRGWPRFVVVEMSPELGS